MSGLPAFAAAPLAARLRLVGYGAAIVMVIATIAVVAGQARTIDGLRAQLTDAAAKQATCTETNRQMAADVAAQNAAVDALIAKGEAEQRRADAARAEADRIGAQTQRRVQQAMAAAVPTECPAAMEWLRAEGATLAQEWM